MSTSTKNYTSNLSFLWFNKFRNRTLHQKVRHRLDFRNLNYHYIQNHETVSEIVDYNRFFEEVILSRLQTMMAMYNNNLRPLVYRINLDLMIQHPRERLMCLIVSGLMENVFVNYINLDQRLKSKRPIRHCFVERQSPWRTRGTILLQVGFFEPRQGSLENELESDRPVWIEDTYTYVRQ